MRSNLKIYCFTQIIKTRAFIVTEQSWILKQHLTDIWPFRLSFLVAVYFVISVFLWVMLTQKLHKMMSHGLGCDSLRKGRRNTTFIYLMSFTKKAMFLEFCLIWTCLEFHHFGLPRSDLEDQNRSTFYEEKCSNPLLNVGKVAYVQDCAQRLCSALLNISIACMGVSKKRISSKILSTSTLSGGKLGDVVDLEGGKKVFLISWL